MWELGELCRACFSHGPPTGPVQAPARRFDVGAGTARPSSRPPRAGALLRLSGLKQRGGSGICMRGGGAERRERRSNGIGRPRLTPANRRSRRKGLCDRETLKSCPCPPPSSYLAAADEKGTSEWRWSKLRSPAGRLKTFSPITRATSSVSSSPT
ncbi:uncharacterized protein LOC128057551 isoform X2 [Budorcas taxicolor]|uniref:uncharacterized protein LOC128057551 isoform X2 n=1 Tax=Budorcas taxicolor TaxID=37181 RepID=UPI002283B66B|nr:uncharacterized protein LOC128057551 isoform X2 [Budorcas taxicolor]